VDFDTFRGVGGHDSHSYGTVTAAIVVDYRRRSERGKVFEDVSGDGVRDVALKLLEESSIEFEGLFWGERDCHYDLI
jgi:hypothetical protein